jgi:hypothetical protein
MPLSPCRSLCLLIARACLPRCLWSRMPLHADYVTMIRSTVADVINSTATKSAGACTAAAFLSHFVGPRLPWIHMDIAGIFHAPSPMGLYEKGMTGAASYPRAQRVRESGARMRACNCTLAIRLVLGHRPNTHTHTHTHALYLSLSLFSFCWKERTLTALVCTHPRPADASVVRIAGPAGHPPVTAPRHLCA